MRLCLFLMLAKGCPNSAKKQREKEGKNMQITKEMILKRKDWRKYYIIEYMTENKEYFDIRNNDDLLMIINFIYKNTYNFYYSKDIELYMQCLEDVLFDELMSSEEYHLDFKALDWSQIIYKTYKKFCEIKGE